jgi:glycosyltransferase involved in cell wall biosynthesis
MKILMVHNRYLLRGGEDESTEAEINLLRQHGDSVDFLELDNRSIADRSLLRTGVETVWSSHAYRIMRERIRQGGCDLVHVQNFFPLFSPAIHHAAKAAGKPVVQSLRNYRLFCLNVLFFRDQHICEDCMGKFVAWPGLLHRCYRGDLGASMAVASMLAVHRALGTWQRKVDVFQALTEFGRRKFIEGGLPADRIIVKPNFVLSDPGCGSHDGDFALFVGRLSAEKGLTTLVKAWQDIVEMPLKIVGTGPMRGELERLTSHNRMIELLGWAEQGQVLELMKQARLLVMPAEWYEGFARVLIEAFACGLPVLASNIGAMAEVVRDGFTGLHFQAGNPADLAQKARWMWEHPGNMAIMSANARHEYELKYTAELNYQLLMDMYRAAIQRARRAF